MTALSRIFNVVCCASGLLALSPLFTFIAFAIKFDDGGPVFYLQRRVGRGFKPFRLVKFRTMTLGADRAGLLTAPSDARVTRCGRLLRRYKLDELPQLWNVIQGEMQLVGPRPEVEAYVCQFRDEYSALLSEPPGITDPASLAYRREDEIFVSGQMERQYVSQILPDKLRLSLEYQHRRCLTSDCRILLQTILNFAA
jgi:lipopolysaccharide/colanic/teichoic acid biosynthesis glycosyltransferase